MNAEFRPKGTETATGYSLFPALPTVKRYETGNSGPIAFPVNLQGFINTEQWT